MHLPKWKLGPNKVVFSLFVLIHIFRPSPYLNLFSLFVLICIYVGTDGSKSHRATTVAPNHFNKFRRQNIFHASIYFTEIVLMIWDNYHAWHYFPLSMLVILIIIVIVMLMAMAMAKVFIFRWRQSMQPKDGADVRHAHQTDHLQVTPNLVWYGILLIGQVKLRDALFSQICRHIDCPRFGISLASHRFNV